VAGGREETRRGGKPRLEAECRRIKDQRTAEEIQQEEEMFLLDMWWRKVLLLCVCLASPEDRELVSELHALPIFQESNLIVMPSSGAARRGSNRSGDVAPQIRGEKATGSNSGGSGTLDSSSNKVNSTTLGEILSPVYSSFTPIVVEEGSEELGFADEKVNCEINHDGNQILSLRLLIL
jgi:hypothetical protein